MQVILASDPPLSGSVKNVAPAIVQPGDSVTYTIVLSNSSTVSDVNVLLTDLLDPLLSYVPGSARIMPDGNGVLSDTAGITWTVTVSSTTSVTLTFQAQVSEGASGVTVITNTAVISDSSSMILRSASVTVQHSVYLPLVLNRWPPIPYAPQLHEINKQPLDDVYTLTWSLAASDTPVMYTLQESTSPDLSNPTNYTSPITSYQIAGKGIGVYYYRVRGNNIWGPGEWSNTRSATVLSRQDDFDNPITGWTERRTSSPYLDLVTATYSDGRLLTGLRDKFDFAIFSPMFEAPSLPYSIRMRTRIVHTANEVSYGIVFGSNDGTYCPVDRSNAGGSSGCFAHYYRLNVVWGGYLKCQVKRIEYHSAEKGSGRGTELLPFKNVSDKTLHDGWNTWEIKVYEDGFAVYVNGQLLGWTDDTVYINEPYYGIFISTYEYNSAVFEHEYFHVTPLPATEALPDSGYLVPGGMNWYRPLPQTEQID
jgi:uncharacterized repeat protein (TIGR01451 family)